MTEPTNELLGDLRERMVRIETPFRDGLTLHWHNRPIRVIQTADGTPWWALPDLCDALGYWQSAADMVNDQSFPEWARHTVTEDPNDDGDGEPQDVTVLSPVGVWLWTHLTDPGRGQNLASWVKREALRLNPDAAPNNRHVYLTLLDGGELPPYPFKYSGRKSEWAALKESAAYLFRFDPDWEDHRQRVAQRAAERDPAALEARKAVLLAQAQARLEEAHRIRAERLA